MLLLLSSLATAQTPTQISGRVVVCQGENEVLYQALDQEQGGIEVGEYQWFLNEVPLFGNSYSIQVNFPNQPGPHILRVAGARTGELTINTVSAGTIDSPVGEVCYDGATTLTATGVNGQNLSWQYRKASDVNWSTLVNDSGVQFEGSTFLGTVSTGNLQELTLFRIRSDNSCGEVFSHVLIVDVGEELVKGSITGHQEICAAETPSPIRNLTFASGGAGGFSYSWEYSEKTAGVWSNFTALPASNNQADYQPGPLTKDTRYRRVVRDDCGPKESNAVTVEVRAGVAPGAINGSKTICAGNNAGLIGNQESASIASGSITYEWQRNTGSGYVKIHGATGSTYSPGILERTTSYIRIAKGSCDDVETAPVTVSVQASFEAGTISGVQQVCYQGVATPIVNSQSAGAGSTNYKWERSIDNLNWTSITGATAATYTPTSDLLTTDTYFRRVASNNCYTAETNAILVTVGDELEPGNIFGGTTICSGETAGTIQQGVAASAGQGDYTYHWEMNIDGGGWQQIDGSNSITYTPGSLTSLGKAQTVYQYRRVVNDDCQSEATDPVTVTVNDIVAQSIGKSKMIAYLTSPGNLGSGARAGISYQWEVLFPNGVWVKMSGKTGSWMNPGTIRKNWTYRRKETGNCGYDYSNEITITVLAPGEVYPGTISPNGLAVSICPGETLPTIQGDKLPVGGSGSFYYQWQKREVDQTDWQDVIGADAYTYQPISVSGPTYFRRGVKPGPETDYVYSNQVLMEVTITAGADAGPDQVVYQSTGAFTLPVQEEGSGFWSGTRESSGIVFFDDPEHGLLAPGDYTYVFNNYNGCGADEMILTIVEDPIVTSDEVRIPLGGSATLSIADAVSQTGTSTTTATTTTTTSLIGSLTSYQWFMNESLILGANEATYQTTVPGTYYVSFDYNGLSGRSQEIAITAEVALEQPGINFVASYRARVAGADSASIQFMERSDKTLSYQYLDGLGRPLQQVAWQASPTEKDIVQPIAYDGFGRTLKSYLPYTGGNDAHYQSNALNGAAYSSSAQYQFYQNQEGIVHDTAPFASTVVEHSPAQRALEQVAPGQSWADHSTSAEYLVNVADEVKYFKWATTGIVDAGYYHKGELMVSKTTDANGYVSLQYSNKSGQLLLKRLMQGTQAIDTYYSYDVYGNLKVVLPPEGVKQYESGAQTLAAAITLFGFEYRYDGRNRMVEKKVPGAAPILMVYDKWDRLVLTQDGRQRVNNEWVFTKYDKSNRPIMTGIYVDNDTETEVRDKVRTSNDDPFEVRNGSAHGYSDNRAFPDRYIDKVLSVTHYDEYPNSLPFELSYNNPGDDFTGVRTTGTTYGQVLGTEDYLWSVLYYDEEYRVLQAASQNHLGGRDIVYSEYDFIGQVMKTRLEHKKPGEPTITINERFAYDNSGRIRKHLHQINDNPEVLLATMN